MTERCQTKFIEKFECPNYIIYIGISSASVAVLYFYRFHFIVLALGYVLGCVACYYGLKSSVLYKYVQQLKCHFVKETVEERVEDEPVKGCETCGSEGCSRHDPSISAEPWVGLQVHKQLDQAIEDLYNTILDQFINSWYSKITLKPFFVDELRYQLRYASACLLRRAIKVDHAQFLITRVVPCVLRHYTRGDASPGLHPAVSSRNCELRYLRSITNAIMPYLLRNAEVQNSVFRVLIREVFAGWVLLSLTDCLADPYILNTLIILATGDKTMPQLPSTPNYEVEFLETFARHTDSVYLQRSKLLKIDLEMVVNDPEHFYAFMQYLKATSHLHLLHFYKDIKLFQTKLLTPELNDKEEESLREEAERLFSLHRQSLSQVTLDDGPIDVTRLRTSKGLYQAVWQTHSILERVMLPRFLHSEEYYKLVMGSRTPIGYQKQMSKKPQEKLLLSALKLGNKLRGALKTAAIDGQVLESLGGSDLNGGEGVDNVDLLKYLDGLAADDTLREEDLSTYKVVLTNVETRLQPPPRRGTVRVFSLAVHRAAPSGACLWSLERSEHDFHLLRAKLLEFHGEGLLMELPLPSRRDNSPMETLRYKYEDFLQRLLQKSLLQTSELLRLFLTVDGDFSMVVQASTLNANSSDIANIYQSVAHKLRKEKGQHLESFLKNLLVSSDIDRYQALKQGTAREVEEAQEMDEESTSAAGRVRSPRGRSILGTVFGNNFDIEPETFHLGNACSQIKPVCLIDSIMFLLERVIKARRLVVALVAYGGRLVQGGATLLQGGATMLQGGATVLKGGATLTQAAAALLQRAVEPCHLPRRIATLLTTLLIDKKSSSPRSDPVQQRDLARKQLLQVIPPTANFVMGPGLLAAAQTAFEMIQKPHLNKQLVYNLLDLCLLELFPELNETSNPSREPKI